MRACGSVTAEPTSTTTPHGSWPAMAPAMRLTPPVTAPPGGCGGARYWCRSDPHMPEALISSTTSFGPGEGSSNSRISS